jgi:hypothetical protein
MFFFIFFDQEFPVQTGNNLRIAKGITLPLGFINPLKGN